MTDYYCDPTAAVDGDGTSPANAANDFFALLANTHSLVTLTGGDRVFLRSKSGGANVRVTLTAHTHMYTGYASPVQFIVDDGTYWAGDEGYFELGFGTSGYWLYWGPWISMLGTVHSVDGAYTLRFVKSNTNQNQPFMYTTSGSGYDFGLVQLKNAHFYSEVGVGSGKAFYAYINSLYTGVFEFENILYDGRLINTASAYQVVMDYRSKQVRIALKNWSFENTSDIGLSSTGGLASHSYNYGATIFMDNVDCSGFPSTYWMIKPNGYSNTIGNIDTIKNSPVGSMEHAVADWKDAGGASYLGSGSDAPGYIAYEGNASNDYRIEVLTRTTKAIWNKAKFIPTLQSGAAVLPEA